MLQEEEVLTRTAGPPPSENETAIPLVPMASPIGSNNLKAETGSQSVRCQWHAKCYGWEPYEVPLPASLASPSTHNISSEMATALQGT